MVLLVCPNVPASVVIGVRPYDLPTRQSTQNGACPAQRHRRIRQRVPENEV